jgi:hypothetical protein
MASIIKALYMDKNNSITETGVIFYVAIFGCPPVKGKIGSALFSTSFLLMNILSFSLNP